MEDKVRNVYISIHDCINKSLEFDVDISWSIQRRRLYLMGKIAELRLKLKGLQQTAGDLMQRRHKYAINKDRVTADSITLELHLLNINIDSVHDDIYRFENQLKWVSDSTKQYLKRYSREELERARSIPYYKLMRMPKDNVMIKCPFHEDTNPSFLVRGSFGYCFGCGAREDVIALCCREYGHTFTSAIDFLLSKELQMELRHA